MKNKKGGLNISSWKLPYDTVSHVVNPFDHISMLVNIHCKESLVWFKTSGFYYTISAGPSLKLFLNNKVIGKKGGELYISSWKL